MVVRVVQTEPSPVVQCESSEPGVSNDLNLDVTAMSSSADWTDMGQDFNMVWMDFSRLGIQV